MVMGEGSINLYIYINLQTLQLFVSFNPEFCDCNAIKHNHMLSQLIDD